MADFVEVIFGDGTVGLFQSAEADLVADQSGESVVERYEQATEALRSMASATKQVAETFIHAIRPDEVQLR
jgi:hypothetical protein